MKIWLIRSSEPMPIVSPDMRLMRVGMMANQFAKRGHEVTWFSSSFDHYRKKQLCEKSKIVKVKDNYNIYLIHARGYKKNISVSRIINHKIIAKKFSNIAKKMEKPDLIYVSLPTIDYAEEAVKYGKKYHVPVIVDIRDLWPDIFYHNLPKVLANIARPYIKYLNYKTKKLLKNAFAINSISEDMLNWGLKKADRKKSKYDRYFYIGYDKKEEMQTKIKLIDDKKFNIAFFATINNQFDYPKIAELANNLYKKDKDIIINICGDGPQFELLKDNVKKLPNVKLFGWTNRGDLVNILEKSKIGLAPYKNTFDFQMSVSNKFAEYASYGLPIVIYSEGYMKKLINEHDCGISSQDMNKICNYIIKLKKDKKRYKEVSNNAKKIYEEKFIAKKIYKELVDYLEELGEEVKK